METIDKYDLLLESIGFRCKRLGITEEIIEQNQDVINSLKAEIGMTSTSDQFNLILFYDMKDNFLEVIDDLHDIGCGDKSFEIIKKVHNTGFAIVKSGSYKMLITLQKKLILKKYRTVVRRVEK